MSLRCLEEETSWERGSWLSTGALMRMGDMMAPRRLLLSKFRNEVS